ncbi:histidine phosphatase family protein [Ferrimicrobium sp.]|uniref:histidine phosphatase family protein n=1 Tax=Ferrimicrobium sp. TaxID=2926050 RepID=UPI00261A36F8|nr:histidine phosphatase family protein [Ferrimicrobium sp.]
MTDVVLVRHGETVWHAENRYAGRSDVALTKRGHEQAELLARWATTAGLDALWCSELGRARETAEPCAKASGLVLRVDSRLNEVDFGHGEGLTAYELRQRFPLELEAFRNDPLRHPLPGGEDPWAATARAVACLAEIVEEVPHGRVLVVTHNSLIRLTLCHLLQIPLSEYRSRFPFLHNCGLSEVRLIDGKPAALLQFNSSFDACELAGLAVPDRLG